MLDAMTWLKPSRMRRWLERLAIVAAALATIATSPPRWRLEATSLPPPDREHATRLIVEASDQPEVMVHDGATQRWLRPDGSKWPGKTEYLVPRGATVTEVSLRGICHGGGMCQGGSKGCEIPKAAFVRVASSAAVDTWRAETAMTATSTVLDPSAPQPSYRVVVTATREATLHIDTDHSAVVPQVSGPFVDEFAVTWPAVKGFARPVTVTWTAHAVIEGPCPAPGPCTPPDTEHVEIRSISRYPDGF
jgi:hypothetical protein